MRPLSAFVLILLAVSGVTAQPPGPVRWEYAELSYRAAPARPLPRDPEGKLVKDGDGKEGAVAGPGLSLKWTTGADEVTVKGWDELAERLKTPVKKEASPSSQKIQVLNALGAAGWELVDTQVTSPTPGGVVTGAIGGFGQPGGGGGGGGGFGQGGMVARATAMTPASTTLLFKRRVP